MAYQADGVLTFPDDGSRPAQVIGSYNPMTLGGGTVSVNLDATIVNNVVASGDFLGIRMQGSQTNAQTTIRGVDGVTTGIAPTISLDITAVPEPSSFAFPLILFAATATRRHWRKRTPSS